MESSTCRLAALYGDLVADVMSRLDASALAATACTCSDLRDSSKDQTLWEQLCRSTWPSTSLTEAKHLISSSPIGGFDKFYADSFPLILYDDKAVTHQPTQPTQPTKLATCISPSDFTSLVDVYYKGNCVFSKVLDGIPEAVDIYDDSDTENACDMSININDRKRWFSNCPFKLDLLGSNHHDRVQNANQSDNDHGHDPDANDDNTTMMDGKRGGDLCEKLAEYTRLSWVLFNKKKGKAVNLSSWKPLVVQKSWSSDADYVMHFGCIIPVQERVLPHKLAECVIVARCKVMEQGEHIRWREISMSILDMEGSHINGKKSLMVLNEALYCLRTRRNLAVEKGYIEFKKKKIEMKQQRERRESLADNLCASIEIAVILAICYAFTIYW